MGPSRTNSGPFGVGALIQRLAVLHEPEGGRAQPAGRQNEVDVLQREQIAEPI
jgi:hypothetical protein